jgi:putative phosphoserine phosphatase/1-acylglycerol-3-phosphate O-acyltransferase
VRIAAFFDIDHTLISGDSALLFVRHLLARGDLGYRDLVGPLYYNLLYRLNMLDIYAVFRRYQSWVRGQRHDAMQQLCVDWYLRHVRPRIYPEMAARVAAHQQQGHLVALLSSATTYVAEPLAEELNVEHLLVNRLIVVDGALTGEAVQPLCWGVGKVHWAKRFAGDHDVDLERSYFYSDSITDLPVLELVGNPRPVAPDRFLRRQARRRGWSIVDPRVRDDAR